jgi:diaminopimelate epimerase
MKVNFFKYHGTGNDFIIIDDRTNTVTLSEAQVKHLCHRRFGIGADGLMMLRTKAGYDFDMFYVNRDGRPSSMCGNGGRCLVQFAYDMGIHKTEYIFNAVDGEHKAILERPGYIKLKMKKVDSVEEEHGDFILDTGSPHYVKSMSELGSRDVVAEGKRIRYSERFTEKGINVNFVEELHTGIFVRTYERGVEDETLSCGTGVTASALMFAHNDLGFNRVEVRTLGGHLAVEFDKCSDNEFKDIWLCGPATYVFKGEVDL